MKKIILAAAFVLPAVSNAQTRTDYNNAVDHFKSYYNHKQGDSIYNMMSERGKTMLPREKAVAVFNATYTQIGELQSYQFLKEKDQLATYKAAFEKATLSLLISLDKDNKLETFRFLPYKEEGTTEAANDVVLKTPVVDIHGTYTIPESKSPVPVVLIIAGSGPTDRDGNNNMGLNTNCYKMIADSLKNAGVACLRYDKRGSGSSIPKAVTKDEGVFDDLVSDAAALVKLLREDKRFSKVYILGHSEGSLVAMLAAQRQPVAGVISLSGPAERIDKTMLDQIAAWPNDAKERSKKILDSVRNGYIVENVPENLYMLFRPSVQPFLQSWMKYEPTAEIKKLEEPILIVQGTTDLQVAADQAKKLHKADHKHSKLVMIEGMNHVLKNTPDQEKNKASYSDPDMPLCPGFMESIVSFIKNASAS